MVACDKTNKQTNKSVQFRLIPLKGYWKDCLVQNTYIYIMSPYEMLKPRKGN